MKKEPVDGNAELLYEAVAALNSPGECRAFLGDLCTENEIKVLGQRLYVAKLLGEKQVYNDIVRITGASTATVSRVNRSLQYGNDGYALALERIKK